MPQAHTAPSWPRANECSALAATATIPASPGTCSGRGLSRPVPFPSRPPGPPWPHRELEPQAHTVPSARTISEWTSPVASVLLTSASRALSRVSSARDSVAGSSRPGKGSSR